MSNSRVKPRPSFRNIGVLQLLHYRLPLAGKVSILHRISGILLFLGLPLVLLPLLEASLRSQESFNAVAGVMGHPLIKLLMLVLIWGYLHHFLAGIRYLILDLHLGITKAQAQKSAGSVLVASLLLTVFFALKLFGIW